MSNMLWLEWSQVFLIIIDIAALTALAIYIISRLPGEWRAPHVDMAAGLFAYILGHTIDRSYAWIFGGHCFSVTMTSTAIMALGLIICLRVIGIPRLPGAAWFWYIILAALLSAFLAVRQAPAQTLTEINACYPDAVRHCRQVPVSQPLDYLSCLQRNRLNLRAICRRVLESHNL